MLEMQQTTGDDKTKRRADEKLRRERDAARERERLRNRRPHKHLPRGVKLGRFITSWGPPGIHTWLLLDHREENDERITPELAHDAEVLRELFNFADSGRVLMDPADEPLPLNGERVVEPGRGRHVRVEIAKAIRAAVAVASTVWISIAMERVTEALRERELQARDLLKFARNDRPHGVPRPATDAAGVHAALAGYLRHLRLPLPEHVDIRTINWMLEHLALGSIRGGGRSRKVNAAAMRTLLADKTKLTRTLRNTGKKRT